MKWVAITLILLAAPSAWADGLISQNARPWSRNHLSNIVTSEHFMVHYTDANTPDHISLEQAHTLLENAEEARRIFIDELHLFSPPSDADGKTDIYVQEELIWSGGAGKATPKEEDNGVRPGYSHSTFGIIDITKENVANPGVIAHEYMHVIEFGYIGDQKQNFLTEAIAEWAAYYVTKIPTKMQFPPYPFDCISGDDCLREARVAGGIEYTRWHFFEYAHQRFGPYFTDDFLRLLRDLLLRESKEQLTRRDVNWILDQVLQSYSSSFSDTFFLFSKQGALGQDPFGSLLELSGVPRFMSEIRPASRLHISPLTGKFALSREKSIDVDHWTMHVVAIDIGWNPILDTFLGRNRNGEGPNRFQEACLQSDPDLQPILQLKVEWPMDRETDPLFYQTISNEEIPALRRRIEGERNVVFFELPIHCHLSENSGTVALLRKPRLALINPHGDQEPLTFQIKAGLQLPLKKTGLYFRKTN